LLAACKVQFEQKTAGQEATIINLSEVSLWNAAGQAIPIHDLVAQMSSMRWPFEPNRCIDGTNSSLLLADTSSFCHTSQSDRNPRLTVFYPCSQGLSRVEISNRVDCCQDRILDFQMRVMDTSGNDVLPIYKFDVEQQTYSVSYQQGKMSWSQHGPG
jgi:hypothetical protein